MKSRVHFGEVVTMCARLLRRFAPQVRPQGALLAGALAALLAEVVLRLAEPWALKFVFDTLITPKGEQFPLGQQWVEALGKGPALTLVAAGLVAITGLRALASYTKTIGFAQVGSRVLAQMRADLFRHLQCLSLGFHHRARGGDLVMRVISDVSLLKDALVNALAPLMAKMLVLVGMVAVMFWMNWQSLASSGAARAISRPRRRNLSVRCTSCRRFRWKTASPNRLSDRINAP
jgi:ATP-binding cassette subfamily B protein